MNVLLAVFLLAVQNAATANTNLVFELSVSPLEWKLPSDKETVPLLILWKVKNTTDNQLRLPIVNATKLVLVDESGERVPGGAGGDAMAKPSRFDYRRIPSGWSIYVSLGDLSLYCENHEVFIGGTSPLGGFYKIGPIAPGKYKLRCVFSTEGEPSKYAKEARLVPELWLGEFTSPWISIEVKPNDVTPASKPVVK